MDEMTDKYLNSRRLVGRCNESGGPTARFFANSMAVSAFLIRRSVAGAVCSR